MTESELQSPVWSVINNTIVEKRHLPYAEAYQFASDEFAKDNHTRIVVKDDVAEKMQPEESREIVET